MKNHTEVFFEVEPVPMSLVSVRKDSHHHRALRSAINALWWGMVVGFGVVVVTMIYEIFKNRTYLP